MALLVLPGSVVDRVVSKFTPNELVNLMAKVFIDLSASSRTPEGTAKNIIIPHRSTVSSHNHHALFMPSRLAPLAGTAIKIVSVPTAQAPAEIKAGGLPASTIVLDEQTGEVSAVVNARKLTPLRNAASQLIFAYPQYNIRYLIIFLRLAARQQPSDISPSTGHCCYRGRRTDLRPSLAVPHLPPNTKVLHHLQPVFQLTARLSRE